MSVFKIATLLPAALLALGCILGGIWTVFGLMAMTVVVYALDRVLPVAQVGRDSADRLCWLIAASHFGLIGLAAHAFGTGVASGWNGVALWLGLGLWFGQVANSTAHEMIHRPARQMRRMGVAMFASLLNGHHVSAHLKVHHAHAATDADPNSARKGESVYAFFARATAGEFIAGLRAENTQRLQSKSRQLHPYIGYLAISALSVAAVGTIGGYAGIAALLSLALYAQLQLLLSDYVQHYGLRRRKINGHLEPVGPQHSWNAAHAYSAAMMLNAPRHSDHHIAPGKPFETLKISPRHMPVLPKSLPIMATLALVPPLWRRVMDKRVAKWETQSRETFTKPARTSGAEARVLSE